MFVEKSDKMSSLGLYGPTWNDNIKICLEKKKRWFFCEKDDKISDYVIDPKLS